MAISCTHCGKNVDDSPNPVYSAGDFDPFCNAACQRAHDAGVRRDMDALSNPAVNLADWMRLSPEFRPLGELPK